LDLFSDDVFERVARRVRHMEGKVGGEYHTRVNTIEFATSGEFQAYGFDKHPSGSPAVLQI